MLQLIRTRDRWSAERNQGLLKSLLYFGVHAVVAQEDGIRYERTCGGEDNRNLESESKNGCIKRTMYGSTQPVEIRCRPCRVFFLSVLMYA